MKELSNFFYDKSNWFLSLLFTGGMIAYAALVLGGKSACFEAQLPEGTNVLGLSFGYSHEQVLRLFQSLDEGGLQCYQDLILIWDNIFPIIYALMYIFWISFLYKNVNSKRPYLKYINLYPLLSIALDWLENYHENGLINSYKNTDNLLESDVAIASFVTQIKWMGSGLNYLIIIVGISFLIRRMAISK